MLKKIASGAAAFFVLIAAAGSAYADMTAVTTVGCAGQTNAQLTAGSTITLSITLGNNRASWSTVLRNNSGAYISTVPSSAYTAGVPVTSSYTLTATPVAGFVDVFDGYAPAFAVTCPAAAVPTVSEWTMVLLGLILAGGTALFLQRRRFAA